MRFTCFDFYCAEHCLSVVHQDERVMQLFGLVNTMLANDRITAERDLSIARCARGWALVRTRHGTAH